MADKPGVELAPRDAYSSVAVPIVVIVLFLFVVIPNLRDVDSLGRRVLTRVRPLFTCSWRLLLSCCCPCYVFAENVEKVDGEPMAPMCCAFCVCGAFGMSGMYRDRLYREAGGVNPGHCVNLATHCACGPCALAQESEVIDQLVSQRGAAFGQPENEGEREALMEEGRA